MTQRNGSVQSGIGSEEKIVRHGDSIVFRSYLMDRPGPAADMSAAEGVLDVTLTLPRPVSVVWATFKDFNRWMNRYGYEWDGNPADEENNYLHITNKGNEYGAKIRYLIRKVIPEKVMYFDSMPTPIPGMDGTWSGHNVFTFTEEHGKTTMNVFMEHTWYSSSMPIEELRAIARQLMTLDGQRFWLEYFIPDLEALVRKA